MPGLEIGEKKVDTFSSWEKFVCGAVELPAPCRLQERKRQRNLVYGFQYQILISLS